MPSDTRRAPARTCTGPHAAMRAKSFEDTRHFWITSTISGCWEARSCISLGVMGTQTRLLRCARLLHVLLQYLLSLRVATYCRPQTAQKVTLSALLAMASPSDAPNDTGGVTRPPTSASGRRPTGDRRGEVFSGARRISIFRFFTTERAAFCALVLPAVPWSQDKVSAKFVANS